MRRSAARMCGVFAALIGAGCASGESNLRPAQPPESGILQDHLDMSWAHAQLAHAAVTLRAALANDGAAALERLRLHNSELPAMFTEDGRRRIERLPTGLAPTPGEQRWDMFHRLANAPLVGFCARGVHIAEPNGPEGLRTRGLVADRLLLVGAEPGGLWGAWLEALVLTTDGWRFLPIVPNERQVELPRREHADITLWDCDVGQRPDPSRPLQ